MTHRLDKIDQHLLDDFQRDFPLVPRPFAQLGQALGLTEAEVILRLAALQSRGQISRVGGTVRPNTAGASTLAAMAVPEDRIDEVAQLVNAEAGVNHSYLRENVWNLWFVATAPNTDALAAQLARLEAATGLQILDLRLLRAFNIDLGFALQGPRAQMTPRAAPDMTVLQPDDRPILQALSSGLALDPQAYLRLAQSLGQTEAQVIARIKALAAAEILTRIGVIVRHRTIGWTSNAMVVWNIPEAQIEAAGLALAALPGISLCYRRVTVPGVWPYALYSMIHARSRAEALTVLEAAKALPELAGLEHSVLFSTRCFKQTSAQLMQERAA
ncbi:AsnC family transcriptional regulator [Pseudorhodobacter ferrugineus]|uniref:siroheme decarboxylase subunit beta n=1 Tax=Pseudorhodobacter ferrugineus TaxID=77008 RepID=UPI0003B45CE1|nr:AsnC family transcriptional regulator [Pseudorhodobacter ferrugineus]